MKKFFALLLAALMVFTLLSACDKTPATTDTASDKATDTAAANTDTDTTKEKLVMVTNAQFQPYEYYDNNNNIIGIDAEIAAKIADKLGMELEIQDMQFNALLTAVSGGSADFAMAGMTVREDRKEYVNFSNTYATGVQVIITKADSGITSPDDLADKKIGTQIATTGSIYAKDDYGEDNVIDYNNGNEAVLALIGGAVDAVIIDNEPAKSLVAANEGKDLVILETEYVVEEYAIGVNKDKVDLLNKINAAIDELTADGTIQAIIDKYIPAQ